MLALKRQISLALLALALIAGLGTTSSEAANDETVLRAMTQGGHVAIMRHALAPGYGDPDNFRLDDCATQRNLSDAGRTQAKRIGEAFRNQGIGAAKVYTSQWCRCRETAQHLNLGAVQDLPILNSFFEERGDGPAQTAALRDWLDTQDLNRPTILVTHQVNITSLTGVFPGSGEVLILRVAKDGTFDVVGNFETP